MQTVINNLKRGIYHVWLAVDFPDCIKLALAIGRHQATMGISGEKNEA